MRRLLHLLMASMTAVLLSVAIVAAPALAEEASTEEATEADDHAEEADDHADEGDDHAEDEAHAEEETGFGTGDFDGTLLAAVVGIVLGLVIFGMAKPGEIEKADAHH